MNITVVMPKGKTRDSFFPPEAVRAIEALGTVRWNDTDKQYDPDAFKQALHDADICVTGWGCPRFTAEALEGADRLRLVAHTAGAVTTFISDALFDKGVRVVCGNELFAESVAEGVVGYMLSGLRRIPYFERLTQAGGWPGQNDVNEGLLDQTVGLVGFGAIPKHLVPMLKPFRVKIMAYDPFVAPETMLAMGVTPAGSIAEVMEGNKIVSVHLPRTRATYHIIDAAALKLLRDGALLINTARGSVIDEAALAAELRTGRIQAVLDVYEKEPLPQDSPLRGMDNALLIPHMGGPTRDRRGYVTLRVLEDVARFQNGEALIYEVSREYAFAMTDESLKL